MDRDRFDHLTRGLASATTRRSALRGIAAGALAFGAARGLAAADCGGGNSGGAKKKAKTCLCHISSSGSEGSVICVGGKAANKHLKHGDAVCGDGATCPDVPAPGDPCTVTQQTCDVAKVCNNDNDCRVNGSNDTCRCGDAPEPGADRKCVGVAG